MQKTAIDGISMWSAQQPGHESTMNAYFIEDAAGNLVVDPLELHEADAQAIAARGGIAWVVLTSGHRAADAARIATRFGAKVAAGAAEAARDEVRIDRTLASGDAIGPVRAVAIDGASRGEIALSLPRVNTVIAGPALRGDPAGSLRMAPDEELDNAPAAALSLRALRALYPRHVLVGIGAPVFAYGYPALNACLEARMDAAVNVVNFDELTYLPEEIEHPGYGVTSAEVGWLLGAKVLGYQTARLPPGEAVCPLHWHAGDEELFIVWEGTPTLLSPRGETPLRPGDIVCFVTGAAGAHKVVNRGTEFATLLMIANDAPVDACFYPDSRKVLISPHRVMVRSEPQLKYYDFEP